MTSFDEFFDQKKSLIDVYRTFQKDMQINMLKWEHVLIEHLKYDKITKIEFDLLGDTFTLFKKEKQWFLRSCNTFEQTPVLMTRDFLTTRPMPSYF